MAKTEYNAKTGMKKTAKGFKPCKGCPTPSKCRAAGKCMGGK